MGEAKQVRMERLSAERVQSTLCFCGKLALTRAKARTVGFVAEKRMTDFGKMHTDLMGAAGFQAAFDETGNRFSARPFVSRPQPVMRDGVAPARAYSHFHTRSGIAGDRFVDNPFSGFWYAPGNREITSLQATTAAMISKLCRERAVGTVGLGDDQ